MKVGIPAAAAFLAAWSLLPMPPRPRAPGRPEAAFSSWASKTSTRGTSRASACSRGSLIVEAVDVGEQDEQVGPRQVADEGGQVVVVREPELLGGHGVVFVDDGQHLPLEQSEQGVAGVKEALAALQVVVGQEDLGHLKPEVGEGLFIGQHQGALAQGGHRLLLGDAGWGRCSFPACGSPRPWPRRRR